MRLIAKCVRIDCLSVPQLPASTVLQKHREFQYGIFRGENCSYDAALNTVYSKNTVIQITSKKLIFDTVENSRYVLPLFFITVFLPDMAGYTIRYCATDYARFSHQHLYWDSLWFQPYMSTIMSSVDARRSNIVGSRISRRPRALAVCNGPS